MLVQFYFLNQKTDRIASKTIQSAFSVFSLHESRGLLLKAMVGFQHAFSKLVEIPLKGIAQL